MYVGNIVQGARLAWAQGRDIGLLDDDSDAARKVHIVRTALNSKHAHGVHGLQRHLLGLPHTAHNFKHGRILFNKLFSTKANPITAK